MNDNGHIHATPGPYHGLRCGLCGEAIGVYEPLIAIEHGRARQTSRAAEPALASAPGDYRHLDCHERRGRSVAHDTREHMRTHARAHPRENVLAE